MTSMIEWGMVAFWGCVLVGAVLFMSRSEWKHVNYDPEELTERWWMKSGCGDGKAVDAPVSVDELLHTSDKKRGYDR